MKEYKIGDTFVYEGGKYIIEGSTVGNGCCGCVFMDSYKTICDRHSSLSNNLPLCSELNCIYKKYIEDKNKEESLDLTKILDGCPEGTKFYSTLFGEVEFIKIRYEIIYFECEDRCTFPVFKDGLYFNNYHGECTVFPAKDQRDWSKFERFWDKPNIARFNPKTLKPFDKVLVRDMATTKVCDLSLWKCQIFAFIGEDEGNPYVCIEDVYGYCIPYNEETKHLVGTTEEAPEYYRYWED